MDMEEVIPPAQRTVTRREIRSMPPDEQLRFVRAVQRMMVNPRGPGSSVFARLATIHGGPHDEYCMHEKESFPAWHRAYLVAFERALQQADRELRGDDDGGDIGLPYWDWAQTTVNNQVYPRIIREQFGEAPPGLLDPDDPFVAERDLLTQLLRDGYSGIQDADGYVRSWLVSRNRNTMAERVDAALSQLEHYSFASHGGQGDYNIEAPHDTVHNALGFPMSKIEAAAFHPIFWLHHSNVDRQLSKFLELRERAEESFQANQATPGGLDPRVDSNFEDHINRYTEPLWPLFHPDGRPVLVTDTFGDTARPDGFMRYRYDTLPDGPRESRIPRFRVRARDLPTKLVFTLERSKIAAHTYTFFAFVMGKEEAEGWVAPEGIRAWNEDASMAASVSFFGGRDPARCKSCRNSGSRRLYVDITDTLTRLGLSRHDCGIRVMVRDGDLKPHRLEDVPDVAAPMIVGSLFESVTAPLAKGGEDAPQVTGEVKQLQRFLKRYGWLKDEADGVFGDVTETAVKRFQKFTGLEADGVAGPTTKGKILQQRVDDVDDQDDDDDVANYKSGQEVEYWIGPAPSYLDGEAARAEVRAAFVAWAQVTGVVFKEVGAQEECKVLVRWGRRSLDNLFKFDGPGGALAHSTKDYIYLDNSESWLCQGQPAAPGSYYLYPVVLHSVGHLLGLTHSHCADDVMSPFYYPDRLHLHQGDKDRVAVVCSA